MTNRWGIHAANFAPNGRYRRLDDFFTAGFRHYTILHLNGDLIPQIRAQYPEARILVRMYLTKWIERDPAEWAREIAAWANPFQSFNIELTWANEQNLDLEGHPQGASVRQPLPPVSLYQDIDRWNLEMIRRLRESVPWARLHYPAFANGHSDDQNDGGYVGLEVCRPSIQAADVMDCHTYWDVESGPLQTIDRISGGQRFVLTHNRFPDKPIFISECGNFAVHDPRTPDQYVQWIHSLYHYDYIQGATFFIWDSDDAPENERNVIQRADALVRMLRDVSKEPPSVLPPVPQAPPPAPPVEPLPPVTVPSGGIEYVIQPGDTLGAISKRFNVALTLLVSVNRIADPRLIRAGQTLIIPGATTHEPAPAPADGTDVEPPLPEPTAPAEGAVYIVRSGDTLSGIAKKFNVTVDALVVANGLTDRSFIRTGQRLTIPRERVVRDTIVVRATRRAPRLKGLRVRGGARARLRGPAEESVELDVEPAEQRITYYVTRPGDTLERIARLFGLDAAFLAQVNQISGKELQPGTRLIIPMR